MSQVKKLTRFGSDTRKLAALLQAKAPKGEMLAYISPQEAALLKSRGGSGMPHADTGIPSYQIEYDYQVGDFGTFDYQPQIQDVAYQGPELTANLIDERIGPTDTYADLVKAQTGAAPIAPATMNQAQLDYVRAIGGDAARGTFGGLPPYGLSPGYSLASQGFTPRLGGSIATLPSTAVSGGVGGGGTTATGISDQIANALGIKKSDLPFLGLAGIQTLLGSQQARRAGRQGQEARRQMESMAAPYRAQGAQIQAQAQRGELTPQNQQSLQAAQAQIAQGVQARGGVGATQAAGQIEAIRQQLLQTQADYGLKLSGIGDQIAMGAIREGIQADQYVNQLTSSYMNNVMRMVGSAYGQQQPMIVLGGGGR